MLQPVGWSEEFERIFRLPRRRVPSFHDMQTLAEELTSSVVTETGRLAGCKLKPIQAYALLEAYKANGLFAAITTGGGKTLLTWLLPTILAAKRPLLLVPAKLKREKTTAEFGELRRHWIAPFRPYRIESYSQLSRINSADLLLRYRPDLIVCDEVHKLRNEETAGVQRVGRYVKAVRHDGQKIMFAALTATILRKSLRDFAHLLDWAFGIRSPAPRTWLALDEWCNALDENIDVFKRREVGVLYKFVLPDSEINSDPLVTARLAFRRRLRETTGVVCADELSCDKNLRIDFYKAPDDPYLDEAFKKFRTLAETPDGWPLSDPLSIYRHAFELSCGFFYYWDPRPPNDWLEARREWCAFVRDKIRNSRRTHKPLDTELAVAHAHSDAREYVAWKTIRPTFKPRTVARWLSTSVLTFAGWWEAHSKPGLIWTRHRECGFTLQKLLGIKYYGAGGLDLDGRSIESAPRDRSAIVSIESNGEGRNLQGWSRNLILCTPQAATTWQQTLGRTHREGQEASEVRADIAISCRENLSAIDAAVKEAQFVQQTQGQLNPLLIAQYSLIPNLGTSPRYWQGD